MSRDNPIGEGDEVWDRFCDDLKRAGQVLRRSATPSDDLTRAEGLRFLVRMIRIGFENTFELADLQHPRLFPMIEPMKVYEGVTSDARYHHAFIDGTATHRIRGRRGAAPLIEVSVYTGKAGVHELSHQLGALTERDLVVEADGSFEVVLSPEPHSGNWIETSVETRYVMLRQYAHDWTGVEPADVSIQLDGAAGAPAPLALDDVIRGLSSTADFVARTPEFWADISDYWAGAAVNRFIPQLQADEKTDIGAPIGHRFSCGWFRLEPDQALVATFAPTPAPPYWSLGLANYWYESLGFGEGGSEINNQTAEYQSDGSVRVIIADTAPRGPNWIDTRGHREGTLIFRWSRSSDPIPSIDTELRKLVDVELPS